MNEPRRIAVYGPESTGKTRLAEKLAAHFAAPLVAEYARERWTSRVRWALRTCCRLPRNNGGARTRRLELVT